MLQGSQEVQEEEKAVQCYIILGQEEDLRDCETGRWELGRGRAVWLPGTGGAVRLERAELLLWQRRGWNGLTWQCRLPGMPDMRRK